MPRFSGFDASPSRLVSRDDVAAGVLFAAVQRRNLPPTAQLSVTFVAAENGGTGMRTAMSF